MEGDFAKKKDPERDRSLTATGIVIAVIVVLLIAAYFRINAVLEQRSLSRLEEGVNTVIEEVTSKLERDSRILNATAKILSQVDNYDIDDMRRIMEATAPLLETMRVRVILSDERILTADGNVTDASEIEEISFAREAPLGEHISNRVYSLSGRTPVLRHFVPIVQDGETAALLYGVTELESLPQGLNIDNIYNASAHVYIIDTKTGDFILDTLHEGLGNISEYAAETDGRETKGGMDWEQYTEDMLHLGTGYVVYRTPQTDGWEYMYYAPAGINQWAIAVSVPEKEAFTSVFATRRICIVLGILLAVTVLLYYLWVRNNVQKYTQRAVQQAVLAEKLQKAEAADRAKSVFCPICPTISGRL